MKSLLIIFLLLIFTPVQAQLRDFDFSSYTLNEDSDYQSLQADVLKVANLLLTTPTTAKTVAREQASLFLYKWMQGTPDYTFGTGRINIILGEDVQLVGIARVAEVKYALEDKESVRNNPNATLAVWTRIAEYVANPSNKVQLTPKLNELIEAYKSGQMADFIARHK